MSNLRTKSSVEIVLSETHYQLFYFSIRYGFRGTPLLFVSARPKLGDRQVKLTHVTDWIEKKLKQEFRVSFEEKSDV